MRICTSAWKRAIGLAGVLLALHVASPARADGTPVPAQTSGQTGPLPPPGTYRLIRIGPEALVKEDDRGRITMVDEPVAKRGRGQNAATVLVGLATVGAVLTLGRNELTSDVGGRAGPH